MDDRIGRIESVVEQLRLTVSSLQQRLEAIEAKGLIGAAAPDETVAQRPTPVAPMVLPAPARAKDPYDPIAILSLVGRLLLVLAGGFFLRAMTDAGVLAVPVGIGLAFAYAAVWLFMSDRAGARAQVPSAVLHALAAALTAFPLSIEAATRFKVLDGTTSAMVIAALSTGLLFVAWRRRLRALSWITVVAALPSSAAILIQTGVVVPFALYLVTLGVATLWLSYALDWWGSRWPAALAADVAVAGVTLRAFAPEHRDTPQAAMMMLMLLLLGYFGSIAIRTLVRGREVSRFEIVQTIATLGVTLGGAVYMAGATQGVPAAVGVAAVALGAACYGLAVTVLGAREGGGLNLYFYTSLALVLVLAGFTIAADSRWLGAVFALFGALATGLWSRRGRLFTLLHAAAYLLSAVFASGSFVYCVRAVVAGMEGRWVAPDAVVLAVLGGAVMSAALGATRSTSQGDELAIGARFVIALVCVWTASGALIGYIAPVAGGLADGSVDPGVLATVRTGVLSAATLVTAWIGRRARLREWGWLVYPLLIGTGLKLLAQDFQHSRPATLFIAMALYGAALIVAPRLRRRIEPATPKSDT